MPATMVTNMPRLLVSWISRLMMAMIAAGSSLRLPRQRNRLAALAMSRAALMPLPETSPRANGIRWSARVKKSKKSPETCRIGRLRPNTGSLSWAQLGSRLRWISAARSSSRWVTCWCTSSSAMRALDTASAAEFAMV